MKQQCGLDACHVSDGSQNNEHIWPVLEYEILVFII